MSAWWFSENQNKSISKPSQDNSKKLLPAHYSQSAAKPKVKRKTFKAARGD